MTEEALEYAVKRTNEPVPGPSGGTPYSGDHLQALCRQIARTRLREGIESPTGTAGVERAIEQYIDKPKLTAAEEVVVASHEAGHAITALMCKHAPPIDRISIRGDIGGALGYVKHADRAHRYVVTYAQLRDQICTLFGGREAECLLFDDISVGSSSDIEHATSIARALLEQYGENTENVGVVHWMHDKNTPISEAQRARVDAAVIKILETERERCRQILTTNKTLLIALRDLLLEKKVLDRNAFAHIVPVTEKGAS
jgi:cell division protease FtsH